MSNATQPDVMGARRSLAEKNAKTGQNRLMSKDFDNGNLDKITKKLRDVA